MTIGIMFIIIGVIVAVIGLTAVKDADTLMPGIGIGFIVVGAIICVMSYIGGRNHVSDGELKELRRNTAESYPQLTITSVNAFDDGTGRAQVTLNGSQCDYVIGVVTGDNGLILVQGTATNPANQVFIAGNFAKNTAEECPVDPFTAQ